MQLICLIKKTPATALPELENVPVVCWWKKSEQQMTERQRERRDESSLHFKVDYGHTALKQWEVKNQIMPPQTSRPGIAKLPLWLIC